jgi:phage baseplate assembly protein V
MNDLAVQDLIRRMDNILRPGTISAVDLERGRVRVRLGPNLETAWLGCLEQWAGNPRTWTPPKLKEQVLVLAAGGELKAGYVLRGLPSAEHPRPSKSPDMHITSFDDGLELSYDTVSNSLLISRPAGLKLIVKSTSVEFEADKFEVFNKARVGLIKTISEVLKLIFGSKTSTMMGPQPLLPASIEAPAKAQIIDSFGG